MLDASVVVEYLVAASLTDRARTVFRATIEYGVELWAPDLVYAEAVSALRRLVRLRALAPRAGEAAVADLARLPLAIAGTRSLMSRAWELRDAVTPYDACYVALSQALGVTLITADRRLVRVMTARGFRATYLGDVG